MTDYKEEQDVEIEALESIYLDEMTVVETKPFHSFEVSVKSAEDDFNETEPISLVLGFTYTATYPDEAPIMEIKSSENLSDHHAEELMGLLKDEAEENLGMVMVFTLVSAVQEKLHEVAQRIVDEKKEEEERRREKEQEEERKRFEGTRVTVETFMSWKAKFDADIEEEKRRKGLLSKGPKKLSGKDLFLQDHTFDDSDVKFLDDEGDTVEVDESLFEDMEDLDLEET